MREYEIKKSVYEQVINKALNEEIIKNIDDIYRDNIDHTDASRILFLKN